MLGIAALAFFNDYQLTFNLEYVLFVNKLMFKIDMVNIYMIKNNKDNTNESVHSG